MYAQPGDWLVVERSGVGKDARRGLVEEVTGDGEPPYLVHWLDTGDHGFVVPGSDAHVQTVTHPEATRHRE